MANKNPHLNNMIDNKAKNQNQNQNQQLQLQQNHNNFRPLKTISVPQDIILELENPNLCEICFSSDIKIDKSVKFMCNHSFCFNCVKTYLEKKIDNGQVN